MTQPHMTSDARVDHLSVGSYKGEAIHHRAINIAAAVRLASRARPLHAPAPPHRATDKRPVFFVIGLAGKPMSTLSAIARADPPLWSVDTFTTL